MNKNSHSISSAKKSGKHISIQVISLIFSGYLLIAIMITCAQLAMEYNNEKQSLQNNIDSLAKTFLPTITEALWNYDNDQIQAFLKGLYSADDVFGLSVIGGPKKSYHIGTTLTKDQQRVMHTPENPEKTSDLGKLYDVLYSNHYDIFSPENNKEKLGEVIIYYSSVRIIDKTYQTFIITIISALIKTIALWIIAYLVITRWIRKPITVLQKDMASLNIDLLDMPNYSPATEEAINNNNELYLLRNCFENLCWELKTKNNLVSSYTENLEQAIQERTQKLTDALSDLEKSSQAKTDFLNHISHELRTPLNAIIGFSRKIYQRQKDSSDLRITEGLLSIVKNGEHLLLLINDLLDASKIESGKLELKPKQIELSKLLKEVQTTMQPAAAEKKIKLTFPNCDCEPMSMDPQKVKQILLNLISNAIKFTYQGSVTVECHAETYQSQTGACFTITDTGTGIESDKLETIFLEFEQLDNAKTSSITGTGLGLAIVKKLVELHQGHIMVSSEINQGTQFTVWLPSISA